MIEESPIQNSVSSQFSIKRLFWTMIVASVIFKLADMTGILGFIASNWEFARGSHKITIVFSIVAFSLVAVVYIAWIGIRLPWLIDRYLIVRRKRHRRREKFRQEFEAWRNR